MSKHHVGVTTKLKGDDVIKLEFIAKEKGIKRSALIRKCLLDLIATQSKDEFPSLIAQKQNSPVV